MSGTLDLYTKYVFLVFLIVLLASVFPSYLTTASHLTSSFAILTFTFYQLKKSYLICLTLKQLDLYTLTNDSSSEMYYKLVAGIPTLRVCEPIRMLNIVSVETNLGIACALISIMIISSLYFWRTSEKNNSWWSNRVDFSWNVTNSSWPRTSNFISPFFNFFFKITYKLMVQ